MSRKQSRIKSLLNFNQLEFRGIPNQPFKSLKLLFPNWYHWLLQKDLPNCKTAHLHATGVRICLLFECVNKPCKYTSNIDIKP